MKAVIFFSLGSSYTLPKTLYDSYACQQDKIHIFKNYRLASRGDFVPFRSSKLNVNKNEAVVFRPDTKNKS
jgi:hypothetical protein